MSFADLGLGPETLRAIEEVGYTTPTPIQAQAIPFVLMGRDVLGLAQTGTGKTASFTLPMIEILAAGRARARMPRSLILTPTRELAAQVAENFTLYGKYHKLSMALLVGGESMTDQVRLLDRGVDVLIATPGRLLDLFGRGRILLTDVKILVIDEADRMLDMGFIPDIERIAQMLPKRRQTLFFSATMPPEVKRLADVFLEDPKEVRVSPPAAPPTTVTQVMVVVHTSEKRDVLLALLRTENVKNAFIFCNRKRDIGALHRSLVSHGFSAVMLHGDMPQSQRTETLERFKAGETSLMVCSDVAARGLDVSAMSHVFNYDVPIHAEDYIHRIGRTGRAGLEGRAFTIATPEEVRHVAAIEKLLGKEIPRVKIEGMEDRVLGADESGRAGNKEERGRGRERGRERGRGQGRDRPAPNRVEVVATVPPLADVPEFVQPSTQVAAFVHPSAQVAASAHYSNMPAALMDEQPLYEQPRKSTHLESPPPLQESRNVRTSREPRNERSPIPDSRQGRPSRRIMRDDGTGVGAMEHAEDVLGFGDHVPDFFLIAPVITHIDVADHDEDEVKVSLVEIMPELSRWDAPTEIDETETLVEDEPLVEIVSPVEAETPVEILFPVEAETRVEIVPLVEAEPPVEVETLAEFVVVEAVTESEPPVKPKRVRAPAKPKATAKVATNLKPKPAAKTPVKRVTKASARVSASDISDPEIMADTVQEVGSPDASDQPE